MFQEWDVISAPQNSTNGNAPDRSVYKRSFYRSTEHWEEGRRGELMNLFQESKSLNEKKCLTRCLHVHYSKPYSCTYRILRSEKSLKITKLMRHNCHLQASTNPRGLIPAVLSRFLLNAKPVIHSLQKLVKLLWMTVE